MADWRQDNLNDIDKLAAEFAPNGYGLVVGTLAEKFSWELVLWQGEYKQWQTETQAGVVASGISQTFSECVRVAHAAMTGRLALQPSR